MKNEKKDEGWGVYDKNDKLVGIYLNEGLAEHHVDCEEYYNKNKVFKYQVQIVRKQQQK